jgi:hypothetical protein
MSKISKGGRSAAPLAIPYTCQSCVVNQVVQQALSINDTDYKYCVEEAGSNRIDLPLNYDNA